MSERAAVFVVDDEKRMCESLKALLQPRGYDVTTAISGREALQIIGQKNYDLFLLDICIPDHDGFSLMEHILNRLPDTPVIMMTGEASVDSAVKALREGAYDYLKKPFETEELVKTIDNALRQKMLQEINQEMEDRLRASEKRFRFMVHNSPDMIYILDAHGRFSFLNHAAEKLFGYRSTDLVGKPYQTMVYETDLDKACWRFNERRTGKRATSAFELRLKPGPGKAPEAGRPNEFAVVELNATGVYRRTGTHKELIGTYGVARDKTLRKILETQLLQAKKIEALGNLAGGIAHDFNNLLMGIQGLVSLMLFKMEADNPFVNQLKMVEQYVQDGAGLTRQLLTFARGGALEIQPTDVNALLQKQNQLFGRTRKDIRISERLVPNVLPIEADPSQIEQVLLNIYVNAGHAMPDGGELNVQTENILLTEKSVLARSSSLKPGRHVKIMISDTGIGMDESTLQRIFDPFFTTKKLGKGSGLGLYCAYGIIKNHGGHIQVVSKEKSGTTFTIFLPATERKIAPALTPPPHRVLGRETVLLVDDEDKIREVCREGLKLLGYSVVVAESGERAVEIYKKMASDIDIVVLDMIMPGLSGKETYLHLKQINPDVRVLIASGYSFDNDSAGTFDSNTCPMIQKPFKIEKLSMKIQEMMSTT
ncbi:MAG: response regulator [Desulfobacterales bacterium]